MMLPTDSEIMDVIVVRSGEILPTYYLKNILRGKFRDITTPWLRRRLKALEAAGKVRRVSSDYAAMICWDKAEVNGNQSGDGAPSTGESKGEAA
jgi:repressor of nif and glnA expression